MKNICFFSGDITRSGGTERAASLIANELALSGNYSVIFLSLTEQNAESFFQLNKSIKRFHLSGKWLKPGMEYLPLINKVRKFSKEHDIDVIIDIDIVLDALSYLALVGSKTKIVSWEHFNYYYENSVNYRKIIRNIFTSKVDALVTLTETDAEVYREFFKRKLIVSIHNPVILPETTYTNEKREKWILTIGHLIYRKGVDMLAEIGCNVLLKNPGWKWIVLGDGELKPILEKTIIEEELEDRFIVKGRVKNVSWYLERARLFVLPSRIEGLPMCLLEALAAKVPSVSFDIRSGPSEIIKDNETGYLIKPFDCELMEDKIDYLLNNPKVLEQFAENTSDYIGEFQIEKIVGQWNEVLSFLLKE